MQEAGNGFPVRGGNACRDELDTRVVRGQAGWGELDSLRGQLDEHRPAVARMLTPLYPPGSFEPVDQHGDGAGGERQPVAELALRERPSRFKVLERVQTGGADAADNSDGADNG